MRAVHEWYEHAGVRICRNSFVSPCPPYYFQVALCILEDLASANNLCREAIVVHSGVPVLMQAAGGCSGKARRAVAGEDI